MIGERRGVCICPNDVISHSVGLTVCHQCLMMPGHVLRSVITHRRLEVLGVHLQEWKKYWRINESKIMYANEGVGRGGKGPRAKLRRPRDDEGFSSGRAVYVRRAAATVGVAAGLTRLSAWKQNRRPGARSHEMALGL